MTFRRSLIWTSVAFAAALTIGVPSMAGAQAPGAGPGPGAQAPAGQGQGRGRGRGAPPFTPAPGAKDLKAVMFNWAWYTGMLRSSEEYDLLMSLDYQGKGTMQVGGQPCNVTMYRSDISYQTSGERIRITGTRPNGQSCSTDRSPQWSVCLERRHSGCRTGPGQRQSHSDAGNRRGADDSPVVRPAGCVQGRIRWDSPDPPSMTPRPQRLAADVMTIGKTSVAWVGNKPVLTFPIPGVPTATATATLDAKFMAESVVVKNGANTYEFTYSDYKDWNNPLNPAEALYAGRMTEKKNGTVVRDITTTLTETGQMYVVMPVPASVKAAIKPTNQPPNWTLPAAPATQTAAAVTPRLANGKPDLTGVWGGAFNPITGSGTRRCGPTQKECKTAQDNFWVDYEWISPSTVWGVRSPHLQTRVLGQGAGTRSVDEQVRSDHDVPADGDSAGAHAPPHLPDGERHHDAVYDERLRRRKQGISLDSNRRSQARSTEGDRSHLHGIYRGALGGRHAGARLHLVRRFDVVGTRRPLPFREHAHRGEIHA